jgi:hypothetical protein
MRRKGWVVWNARPGSMGRISKGFLGQTDRAGGGGRQGHWGGQCESRRLGDRRTLDGKCQTQAGFDAGQMSKTSAGGYTDQRWQKGTKEAKDDESRMKTAVVPVV